MIILCSFTWNIFLDINDVFVTFLPFQPKGLIEIFYVSLSHLYLGTTHLYLRNLQKMELDSCYSRLLEEGRWPRGGEYAGWRVGDWQKEVDTERGSMRGGE